MLIPGLSSVRSRFKYKAFRTPRRFDCSCSTLGVADRWSKTCQCTCCRTPRVLSNPARDQWITATALSTALNVSYMADQLALFGIMVGIALLLTGIGFGVLAGGLLGRKVDAAGTVAAPG